jgi:hypothetical protein
LNETDETNNIIVVSLPDVYARIVTDRIVPSRGADRKIKHFFGGETVNVPVVVGNMGGDVINGTVEADLYLSTTPVLAPGAKAIAKQVVRLQSPVTKPKEVDFNSVTIPRSLKAGKGYYVVALVRSIDMVESGGATQNNIGASAHSFKYFGVRAASRTRGANPRPTR